jgi:hypothetical protein
MQLRSLSYLLCLSMACVAAAMPYVSLTLFGYNVDPVIVDSASAVVWFAFSYAAFILAGEKARRWLPFVAGPFALWRASVTTLTFLLWKVNGFAP